MTDGGHDGEFRLIPAGAIGRLVALLALACCGGEGRESEARPVVQGDSGQPRLNGRVLIGAGWEQVTSRPFWPCCTAAREFGHGDRIEVLPKPGSGLPGALVRIVDSEGMSIGDPAGVSESRQVLLIDRALPSTWGLALPIGGRLEIRVSETATAAGEQPHKHDFEVKSTTQSRPAWTGTITATADSPCFIVFGEADDLAVIGPVVKMPHLLVLVRVESPVRTAITDGRGSFEFEHVPEGAASILVTHACSSSLGEARFSLVGDEIKAGRMRDVRLDYSPGQK